MPRERALAIPLSLYLLPPTSGPSKIGVCAVARRARRPRLPLSSLRPSPPRRTHRYALYVSAIKPPPNVRLLSLMPRRTTTQPRDEPARYVTCEREQRVIVLSRHRSDGATRLPFTERSFSNWRIAHSATSGALAPKIEESDDNRNRLNRSRNRKINSKRKRLER